MAASSEELDRIQKRRTEILKSKIDKLPWYTIAQQFLAFHDEQQNIYGKGEPGNPRGGKKGWSLRDTAEALQYSLGAVSEWINLGRLLNEKGEEFKALSYEEARKSIRLNRKENSN